MAFVVKYKNVEVDEGHILIAEIQHFGLPSDFIALFVNDRGEPGDIIKSFQPEVHHDMVKLPECLWFYELEGFKSLGFASNALRDLTEAGTEPFRLLPKTYGGMVDFFKDGPGDLNVINVEIDMQSRYERTMVDSVLSHLRERMSQNIEARR